jgi:serine/threonine-protein kinase
VNTLDRYEILGELGRGAVSIVYDARDLLTDGPVALKVIRSALWAPPTSAAERLRLLTDAMPEWRLGHPNIVQVYDAGDGDGRLYIAMERLQGRTLRQLLDESPLPSVSRSLRMVAEFASGLAHAHERGVVHRCLKPSNIFILADGRAKITDFGMAPLRDAALASTNHAASLSYMSPEEIRRDEAIDGRSDVFSLGVVLYELLTGARPFGGDSPDEVMRNVLEAEPPLPSQVNGNVPPMVDLLVWSMLAKPPFSRAPSAGIIARRLWRLREELDGVAVPTAAADERASSDVALTLGPRGDDRAPSAEIVIDLPQELREEVDGALAVPARDERASGDLALTLGPRGDDHAPSTEIVVDPPREPREEVDGPLAALARGAGIPAAAATADERASGDPALTLGHQGDDRSPPSTEIVVDSPRELRAEIDVAPAAPARDEGIPATAEMDERASGGVALTLSQRTDDRAPSAEIVVDLPPEPREEALAAPARDAGIPAAVATADERPSHVAATLGHRNAPHGAERNLPSYVLTALILAAAGIGFLLQWQQSSDPSARLSAATSDGPITAVTSRPSIPEKPRPIASAPSIPDAPRPGASESEAKNPASEANAGTPSAAAPASGDTPAEEIPPTVVALAPSIEDAPRLAASTAEPKKRTSRANAGKPSRPRAAVASSDTPAQALPTMVAMTGPVLPIVVAATAPTPPPAKTATLVFDVAPWGEIYVDGKRYGTTPPVNTVELPPGWHRIEVRNSARPGYLGYTTLAPGEVRSVRHHFE